MTRTNIELFVVLCFLVAAALMLNPFGLWMDPMMHTLVLGAFIAFSGAFLALFTREVGGDERESTHRTLAGRAAFIAGTVVLLAGIFVQATAGVVDPWLIYALCAMVIVKLFVRVYCAYRN
ncbi:MAG: hypothetical protein V4644_02745 [Patescibacteria group bacterium]